MQFEHWIVEHVGIPRVVAAGTLLDPDVLTLGFARRFTGYKRPELVFHDPERLARILNAAGRPVQIIFAGKSHPADDIGKHHLQRVYKRALDPLFGGRIAFVDDYDLHVAHFLVQGCDVWLNNPRKPLEASGTSGMKAAINGVPHLSIGDGWWAEGFTGANGWVIDGGAAQDNYDAVDAADAASLYRLLEEEVPLRPLERILERVAHLPPGTDDLEQSLAVLRTSLGRILCDRFRDGEGRLPLVSLEADLNDRLADVVLGELEQGGMWLSRFIDGLRAWYLDRRSEVKFSAYTKHPDYLVNRPGSTLAGRALAPLPFDGRLLGEDFKLLRPPIGEFMALGGMMIGRDDIEPLARPLASAKNFRRALSLLWRHAC